MIQIKVKQLEQLEDAKEELRGAMRKIRRLGPSEPDDFAINQQDQFVQMFHRVAGTIAAVGLFITGLSLFVGGIGIMNIMLYRWQNAPARLACARPLGPSEEPFCCSFSSKRPVFVF